MSWNINDRLCELDVCIQFGWIAIILYYITCRENSGKKSSDRVDTVHGFNGHCPWSQWTLSMDWVDPVHGLSGHCSWTEWTLSMDWVDNVHGLSGQCPWTQWTLSMDPHSNTPARQCPWTVSTESMDFLQTGKVHGNPGIRIGQGTALQSTE